MFDRRRYTGRLTIPLEAETIAALEAVATEAKASVASVARECIRRGLDPTLEAWRKHLASQRTEPDATEPRGGETGR